jgi:hypothetical protein
MATVRNIAISLIRARRPGSSIAATTRTLGRRLQQLLDLIDHR